jgi:putative PIN family toxin of toxin-antitoxin system
MRIAIDTNLLIAALIRPGRESDRIVKEWLDGGLEVVASPATIREAELVLGGPWLARMVSGLAVEALLDALRTRSVLVDDPPRIDDLRLKDQGDLRMVEAAVAGDAKYVVTTDREFLRQRGHREVEFVTPAEFWDVYAPRLDSRQDSSYSDNYDD